MNLMQLILISIMTTSWLFYIFSLDFMGIAERFGYPTALLVVFIFIARALLNQERRDRNDYRDSMLKAQDEQIKYLRELAREQKCFYHEQRNGE